MARRSVRIGDVYGRLTVIKQLPDRLYPSGQSHTVWECRCNCGATKVVVGPGLRSGHTASCGCLRREVSSQAIDKTGQRFGRLVVIERASARPTKWRCQCDCGGSVTVQSDHLASGHTKSCGCLSSDATRKQNSIQGGNAGDHPLYSTWRSMHNRCSNERDDSYPWYGALGVIVCDRWAGPGGFLNFVADVGERPPTPPEWKSSAHYWTLDRIDPFGNYEPTNCRWADWQTQQYNRRSRRM